MCEKNKRGEFLKICRMICHYYSELEKEFSAIEELLNVADSYGISYLRKETAKGHFKASMKNYKAEHIELILSKIRQIDEEACYEFARGMDLCNMYDAIINEMDNSNFVAKIWDMKKELQYLIHSIRRIVKEQNEDKKIAILKGMLAYY